MEPNKEHIRYFLFCFYQKKSASDTHRVICETYGENVIAIKTCANWFKQFKNGNFDISDSKKRFGRHAAVEENELWKYQEKNHGNTSINLDCIDFYYNKKKNCKKSIRTFASIT